MIEYFYHFPPALATFLLAMLPIGELRGAIPVALSVLAMPWWQAYVVAVLGNMVPVILLMTLLGPLERLIRKSKFLNHHFENFLERLRNKHRDRIQKWGPVGLILFVAIPLPITGGWTGSIVAWLFGLPWVKSIFWIFLGVLIAGVVVTLVSLGTISIFA